MLPEWTLLRFIEVFLCVLVIEEICLWFYQRQKTVKTRSGLPTGQSKLTAVKQEFWIIVAYLVFFMLLVISSFKGLYEVVKILLINKRVKYPYSTKRMKFEVVNEYFWGLSRLKLILVSRSSDQRSFYSGFHLHEQGHRSLFFFARVILLI